MLTYDLNPKLLPYMFYPPKSFFQADRDNLNEPRAWSARTQGTASHCHSAGIGGILGRNFKEISKSN